jgi:hypothetical protein
VSLPEAAIEEKTLIEDEADSEEAVDDLTEAEEEAVTTEDLTENLEVREKTKNAESEDKAAEMAAVTMEEIELIESTTDSSDPEAEEITDTKNKKTEEEVKEEPEAHTKEAAMTDTSKRMTTRPLTGEEPTITSEEKTEEIEDPRESTEMMIDCLMFGIIGN